MEKLTKEQKTKVLRAFISRKFPVLNEKNDELEALRESPEYKAKGKELSRIPEEELMDMFIAMIGSLQDRLSNGKMDALEMQVIEKDLEILADNVLQGNCKKDRLHAASIDKG